ncbi:MAG: Uncharacterized protein XE11_2758, partial [Methanomicrobiales archaeon 53_19]
LGAWWLDRHPESPLRSEWVYYKDQVQHDFSAFPKKAGDLKILDPSCGSGHFLVEAFHMLLAMRQEEGESLEAAIAGIVRDNLHGLEIDPRCIQIAGFAVAMEAWKAGFPTDEYLPLPNLACVGLPIRAEKAEWLKLAAGDGLLEGELEEYYDHFKNADSLGSLIQIHGERTLVPHEMLMQKLGAALAKEKAIGDPVAEAFGETASGVLKAVQYFQRKDFHIVVMNPPFLGRGKQSEYLRQYCDSLFQYSKDDLATCFIEICQRFSISGGYYSSVTPQNWQFLKKYEALRIQKLENQTLISIIRLGEHAFESQSAAGAFVSLIIFLNKHPSIQSNYFALNSSDFESPLEKADSIIKENGILINQRSQLNNPDNRILIEEMSSAKLLQRYADTPQGLKTGDDNRYRREFWELQLLSDRWKYYQSTPEKENRSFEGMHFVIDWSESGQNMARLQGLSAWGKRGVAVGQMRELPTSLYLGVIQDSNINVIIPNNPKHLSAIWMFLNSKEFRINCRKLDQKISVTNATMGQVPFDLDRWQKVAEEQYPNGLPEPHSDDPTQWLFKGNIAGSEQPLHVAIARMLGYRWPEQPADNPLDVLADRDGIVCIPPVWGERPAVELLRSILAAAYGSDWSPRKEEELLKQAGYTKNGGLEGFLRDEFFASHSKLFHHRPFIWQVWDGTKDGFSVLLNYHKLDRKTLEKLIYTYLGAWITQQKDEVRQEKPGAEKRLAAAEALKVKLEQIL